MNVILYGYLIEYMKDTFEAVFRQRHGPAVAAHTTRRVNALGERRRLIVRPLRHLQALLLVLTMQQCFLI